MYAKIGLKSLQEYSADDINRQHFQMQFFLALKGLRINTEQLVLNFCISRSFFSTLHIISQCLTLTVNNIAKGNHTDSLLFLSSLPSGSTGIHNDIPGTKMTTTTFTQITCIGTPQHLARHAIK